MGSLLSSSSLFPIQDLEGGEREGFWGVRGPASEREKRSVLKGTERGKGDKLSQDPSSSSPFHSAKKNGNGGRYRPGRHCRATSRVTAPLMLIFPLLSFPLAKL